MKTLKQLEALLKEHKIPMNGERPLDNILNELSNISINHSNFINSVTETASQTIGKQQKEVFSKCPECGSDTILGFGECHLCGTKLFDSVEDEVKEKDPKETKKETKKDKKKEKEEIDELDDDLDIDGFLDDFDLD
jgi:hypothetical protein